MRSIVICEVLASTVYYDSEIVDSCFSIIDKFVSECKSDIKCIKPMNLV